MTCNTCFIKIDTYLYVYFNVYMFYGFSQLHLSSSPIGLKVVWKKLQFNIRLSFAYNLATKSINKLKMVRNGSTVRVGEKFFANIQNRFTFRTCIQQGNIIFRQWKKKFWQLCMKEYFQKQFCKILNKIEASLPFSIVPRHAPTGGSSQIKNSSPAFSHAQACTPWNF